MMIVRAGKDQVIDNTAIDTLFAQVNSTDRFIHEYPEAWHQITRDPDIWDVIEKSIEWIKRRI